MKGTIRIRSRTRVEPELGAETVTSTIARGAPVEKVTPEPATAKSGSVTVAAEPVKVASGPIDLIEETVPRAPQAVKLQPEPVMTKDPPLPMPGAAAAPRPSPLRSLARWYAALPFPNFIGLGFIAAIGVVLAFIFIRFTVDDAFISWRYGMTFAHTGHWNYNPGTSPRVEAYTSFVYAALSVIPALLRMPVELFFKLVGLGILGGYLYGLRRVDLPRGQKVALLALLVCNPTFWLQLFSGLETVAFALLITLVFSLVYRNGELRWAGYAAALALTLTRPEGIAFAGVAMAWSLLITRRRPQVWGLAGVIGIWVAYWGWRWHYFGYFWPNTYYVKSGNRGALSAQVVDVLQTLLPALVVAFLVILVTVMVRRDGGPALARARRAMRNAQDATPAVLALTGAVVVLGLYHNSNLYMNFVNRFQWQLLLPVALVVLFRPLPLGERAEDRGPASLLSSRVVAPDSDLWGILAVVLAAIVSGADNPSRLSGQLIAAAGVAVIAVAMVIRWGQSQPKATMLASVALVVLVSSAPVTEFLGWAAYRYRLQYAHQDMGQVINAAPFNGAVAIGDAGVLPFTIHQPVVDLGGLANAAIAHGTLSPADLQRAHLDMVVALSASPSAGSQWVTGPGPQLAYLYMEQQHFVSSSGPPFTYGYWLNYWIQPRLATPQLINAIHRVSVKAAQQNLEPDSTLFTNNLFNLPFFTNP